MPRHSFYTFLFILCLVAVSQASEYPIQSSRDKGKVIKARKDDSEREANRKECDEMGFPASAQDNRCFEFYPSATLTWGKGFYEGVAKITVNGKSGFIDTKGNVVIAPKFRDVGHFSDGLAPYETLDGKWGFIDMYGKVVVKPGFDWALSFREGLAAVQIGELWGFIDRNGKMLIDAKFEEVSSFSEGFSAVSWDDVQSRTKENPNGYRAAFIDARGEVRLHGTFDGINRSFDGGLAVVSKSIKCSFGACSETFIVDKTGKKLWALNSWYVSYFSGDAITVADGEDKWGNPLYKALGRDGKPLFEETFSRVEDFSEGLAPARKTWEGKYGYIDKTGRFLIEPRYTSASKFSQELAAVEFGAGYKSGYGYIGLDGKMVIPPSFEFADEFQGNFALVAPVGKDKYKTGYIDRSGKYIWKPTK